MMNRTFKMMLVLVDAGLLLYWGAVLLGLIPEEMRFKDYDDPVVEAWNWSFFPLDISAAVTVFLGAHLTRRGDDPYAAAQAGAAAIYVQAAVGGFA